MNSADIDDVIQKYVQGTLSESEAKQLAEYLEKDSAVEARSKLRLALKADAYLQEVSSEIEPVGDAIVTPSSEPVSHDDRSAGGLLMWVTLGSAAALILGVFIWNQGRDHGRTTQAITGIATILRVEGQASVAGHRMLTVGDVLYQSDRVEMSEGLIELVFRQSGVHAIATAPLALTAESTERAFLHQGDVKLHVPPQGIGFVVETKEREITDLGTVFVVTAREQSSQVFVLDGQVSVGERNGVPRRLMTEGEVANFGRNGQFNLLTEKTREMPELPLAPTDSEASYIAGTIFGLIRQKLPTRPQRHDVMGRRFAPLIESGFQNQNCLKGLHTGRPLRFSGIAGAYREFAEANELENEGIHRAGWLAWYSGRVSPPSPGRYRFWGYADNNLLIAINGKPVFNGSRDDSAFREFVDVKRQDHPAWPCLNAKAGFASGPWIELGDSPVTLDVLFGEVHGDLTFGLLLVEREGDSYEETYWGQPRWPLFLTEPIETSRMSEFEGLRDYMEEKLIGSFSVSPEAVWRVEQ